MNILFIKKLPTQTQDMFVSCDAPALSAGEFHVVSSVYEALQTVMAVGVKSTTDMATVIAIAEDVKNALSYGITGVLYGNMSTVHFKVVKMDRTSL